MDLGITNRQGAVSAVLLEGVSVAFTSFGTVLVFWLSHSEPGLSQEQVFNRTIPTDGSNTASAQPFTPYVDKSVGVIPILLVQCLIEGVFMSSAVGVPTLLAYLARQAEARREEERHADQEWEEGRSQSGERRHSFDTLTSNELRGILVSGPWCDEDTCSSNTGGRQPGKTVMINHHIEYDPPPPPPIPQEQVRSCLKYSTRPRVIAAAQAQIVAAICLAAATSTHLEIERERTPMPITLPPRHTAMLCIAYGLFRFLAALCQYNGIVEGVGLTTVAVLAASAPAISALLRSCKGTETFNRCHYFGFLLCAAAIGMVAANTQTPGHFAITAAAGFCLAVGQHIYNVIRPQVHPYFIAVSYNVIGGILCGVIQTALQLDGPSGKQWGHVMILSVLCLISDTALANGAPESQYIPVGFARAVAIALALGIQTVVLEEPPSSLSSLGAILGFSAFVLLEVGRMSAKNMPYVPLSALHLSDIPRAFDPGSRVGRDATADPVHPLTGVDGVEEIQLGESASGLELGQGAPILLAGSVASRGSSAAGGDMGSPTSSRGSRGGSSIGAGEGEGRQAEEAEGQVSLSYLPRGSRGRSRAASAASSASSTGGGAGASVVSSAAPSASSTGEPGGEEGREAVEVEVDEEGRRRGGAKEGAEAEAGGEGGGAAAGSPARRPSSSRRDGSRRKSRRSRYDFEL